MPTATASKRTRTRDSLLVALQELLLNSDACAIRPAISVPQVVARCGVAQGTFYNYFDSLPEAIDAVGVLLLSEHTRVLTVVTAGSADTAEIVARSARQTLMLFLRRPEVGRLIFDSGLPVDRFAAGLRGHLHDDLRLGISCGEFSVPDFDIASTVYTGTMLGACLDLYRGQLAAGAIPEIVSQLLRGLGVSARKAQRLAGAPQEFVQWAPFPLSVIEEV